MSRSLRLILATCLAAVPFAAQADFPVPPDPAPKSDWPTEIKVDIPAPRSFFDPEIVYADLGGPFVAIGRSGGKDESRNIHDLRTGKQVGTLRHAENVDRKALSPDGKLFAVVSGGFNAKAISITDVAGGKTLAAIPVKNGAELLQFISSDRIVYREGFGDRNVTVVDAKTGKAVHSFGIVKFGPRIPPVVSAGGKYLAVLEQDDLTIYSLDQGSTVVKFSTKPDAKVAPGQVPRFFNPEFAAFSPDGTELAVISGSGHEPRIRVFSLKDGKETADLNLDKPGRFIFYDGPKFEWTPDGSAWLINGDMVCDRSTGKMLWRAPEAAPGKVGPRRALAVNAVAYLDSKDREHRTLRAAVTDPTKLAAIRTAVRSGGSAVDVALPKLKNVDLSKAKTVDPALPGVPFKLTIDAVKEMPEIARRPVPLPYAPLEIDGVFVAPQSAAGPVALFDLAKRDHHFAPPSDTTPRRIAALSLTTGKSLKTFELPAGLKVAAVSADGRWSATIDTPPRRIDVWSNESGEHVAGWKPYPNDADAERKLLHLGFHGERVVTVNGAGLMIGWNPKTAEPEYQANYAKIRGVSVSPTGRYLIGVYQGVVRFIDTATGAAVGDLEPKPGTTLIDRAQDLTAVRADGGEVAALVQRGGTFATILIRWDRSGKLIEEESCTLFSMQQGGLRYAADGFLLVDNQHLYDLKRRAIVWMYVLTGAGRFAAFPPDGRTWYVGGDIFNKESALVAAVLPETSAVDKIKEIADGPNTLLTPGSTVSAKLKFTGSHAEAAEQAAMETLKRNLPAYGLKYDDAGNLKLNITVSQHETGEVIEFRKMFSGIRDTNPFARMTVKEIELRWTAELANPRETLWKSGERKLRMPEIFGIIRIPDANANLTDYLYKQLWNRIPDTVSRTGFPRFMAKTANGIESLPGSSQLTPGGPVLLPFTKR